MSNEANLQARINLLEAQLNAALANTPVFMFAINSQGIITFAEGQALATLGLTPNQLMGQSGFEMFAATPEIIEPIRQVLTSGESVTTQTNVGPTVFQSTYTPHDGGVIGLSVDITPWKQAEKSVQEQQAFLRKVIDALPARVFWKDADLTYLGCNQAFADDSGLAAPEQLIGRTDYEMAWSEQAELYRGDDRAVIESGRARLNFEEPQTRSDGSVGWLRTSKIPLYDTNGCVTGVLGVYEDITERKQTEETVREQREFLRKVLDMLPARVFWKDAASLTFLGCNQLVAQDAGLSSPEQLIGKTDYDMPWAEQAELYRQADRAVIESGQARINIEEPQTRPDGTVGWLRTSKMPLYDASGNITGVLGVFEDITERKLADVERERLQQQVIEAQRQALADLSSPIIPIMDNIIVMPLVGSIDTARSRDIMRALLGGISEYRARVAILDITGVPVVDSGVADHLNHTIQAARLKGAHAIVTGISDSVAETIVDLGIDWSQVETLADLQSGLIAALARIGVRLTTSNQINSGK